MLHIPSEHLRVRSKFGSQTPALGGSKGGVLSHVETGVGPTMAETSLDGALFFCESHGTVFICI